MSELEQRVSREKISHDEDGVLENSKKLHGMFYHVKHSPTMVRCERDLSRFLSAIKDKNILDIGSGFGEQSFALAQRGANIHGIDISDRYVESARENSIKLDLNKKCTFHVMDVHNLEFPDDYFDLIVGKAIIHHLDLHVCMHEIKRVLKPGGRAIFFEPLADNPLLKLFRWMTPRSRTIDEKPLSSGDLDWLESQWLIDSSYYGLISAPIAMLTSIIARPFPNNIFLRIADFIELKLNKIKIMHKYNQYVLLNLIKK